MPYLRADGTDPLAVYEATEELADYVRNERRPAILHLRTVRYGGHAGTDVEASYRTAAASAPIVSATRSSARPASLVAAGLATPGELERRVITSP